MFAAGLLVPHEKVIAALRVETDRMRAVVRMFMVAGTNAHEEVTSDMILSLTFETAEAAAAHAVGTSDDLAVMVRRRLRKADQPAEDEDVRSVLTAAFGTLLGAPPLADDVFMLEQLLYAFDAHGLIDPAFPGAPVVLPEGPAGLAGVLALGPGTGSFDVPEDLGQTELESVRQFCSTLGPALAAIPDHELVRRLGGEGAVGFWQPEDPAKVALLLTHFVNVGRVTPLDPTPIIAAVQERGWLQLDEEQAPGKA